MDFLHIILPILIGALIGYCTNYIAIKMLFRPHKAVFIGKWQLPFTPGVIPQNQGRLANAVGDAISGQLLTKEAMTQSIEKGLTENKAVSEFVDSICDGDLCILDVVLEKKVSEELLDKISGIISKDIIRKVMQMDLKDVISSIGNDAMQAFVNGHPMIALFLNQDMKDAIYEKLASAAYDHLEDRGTEVLKGFVKDYIRELIERPVSEMFPGDDDRNRARVMLNDMIKGLALKYGTALLNQLDVKEIVRKRIEEMDVDELERLVLSVMKHELSMVINLGAVIGAVIGIINIFI